MYYLCHELTKGGKMSAKTPCVSRFPMTCTRIFICSLVLLLVAACGLPFHNDLYDAASRQKSTPVTGISLDSSSASIVINTSRQLIATIFPANATDQTIIWTSSDTNLATVSATGLVTAIASSGNLTIRAMTQSGGFIADCQVTLTASVIAVTGVSLNATALPLTFSSTAQLTPTIAPANATDQTVTWTSSDTSLATVSTGGLVTAGNSAGSVTITATTVDGNFTANCIFTVSASVIAMTGVSVSPTTITLPNTTTVQLTPSFVPASASDQTVVWTISDTSLATVTTSGLVTALADSGTVTITVTTNDGGFNASCIVTLAPPPILVTGVALNSLEQLMLAGQTYQLVPSITPSGATDQTITWSSANPAIASVDTNGLVTAVGVGGPVTITATAADGGSVFAGCNITVGAWQPPLGGTGFVSSAAGITMTVDVNDNPYIFYVDGTNNGVVKTFNGTAWVNLANNGAGFSTGNIVSPNASGSNLAITVDLNSNIYVAFPDSANSKKARVYEYDGSGWADVVSSDPVTYPTSVGEARYLGLAMDNSTPYLVFSDGGASNAFAATVLYYSSSTWNVLGTRGSTNGNILYLSLGIDQTQSPAAGVFAGMNNGIFEAYIGQSGSPSIGVFGFNSPSYSSPKFISLAIDTNGKRYVGMQDTTNSGKATVILYNSGTNHWDLVGGATVSSGVANYISMAIGAGNTPFVAYQDATNSNKLAVMKFDGTNWVSMGSGLSTGQANNICLVANKVSGHLFVSYDDGAGAISVLELK